jgi:hypothetical protein
MCEMQNEEDQGKLSETDSKKPEHEAHTYNSAMVESLAEGARTIRKFAQPAPGERLPLNRLRKGK